MDINKSTDSLNNRISLINKAIDGLNKYQELLALYFIKEARVDLTAENFLNFTRNFFSNNPNGDYDNFISTLEYTEFNEIIEEMKKNEKLKSIYEILSTVNTYVIELGEREKKIDMEVGKVLVKLGEILA